MIIRILTLCAEIAHSSDIFGQKSRIIDSDTLCRNCSQFRYIWSEIADYSNMRLNKNMWSVEKKTNLNWELRTSIQSFVHATSITTHTHTHARLYQRCSRGNFLAMNHCHFRDSVKLDQLVRARDCQSRGRRFDSSNNSKKIENSNLNGFELHRPSNKGTKLLLQVIKAINNQSYID